MHFAKTKLHRIGLPRDHDLLMKQNLGEVNSILMTTAC